jgi:hypothetical protein
VRAELLNRKKFSVEKYRLPAGAVNVMAVMAVMAHKGASWHYPIGHRNDQSEGKESSPTRATAAQAA